MDTLSPTGIELYGPIQQLSEPEKQTIDSLQSIFEEIFEQGMTYADLQQKLDNAIKNLANASSELSICGENKFGFQLQSTDGESRFSFAFSLKVGDEILYIDRGNGAIPEGYPATNAYDTAPAAVNVTQEADFKLGLQNDYFQLTSFEVLPTTTEESPKESDVSRILMPTIQIEVDPDTINFKNDKALKLLKSTISDLVLSEIDGQPNERSVNIDDTPAIVTTKLANVLKSAGATEQTE